MLVVHMLLFAGCVLRWHQRDAHVRPSAFEPASVTQLLTHLSSNASHSVFTPRVVLDDAYEVHTVPASTVGQRLQWPKPGP